MLIKTSTYRVIGLMSGTSLDGLDVAFCEFDFSAKKVKYKIGKAHTFSYSKVWINKLTNANTLSTKNLQLLNVGLGKLWANSVSNFIKKYKLKVDFLASHGHTVFHEPAKGFTMQIGSAHELAAQLKIPVIYDFRSLDVALGGQGAPLVPIGDRDLFSPYDCCINLGGIANISFDEKGKRKAYDVSICNILPNYFAQKSGKNFDKGGASAKGGKVNLKLLGELNRISYFYKKPPKSLDKENTLKWYLDIFKKHRISFADKMATYYHHVAFQIEKSVHSKNAKVLLTGGGVYNGYLINCLKKNSAHEYCIPDKDIIEYKEALVFAYLGVLRWRNEINVLKSYTGAKMDSCSGSVLNG